MENYNEMILEVNINDLETAEAIANMVVPYGIYTEDYSCMEQDADEIAHIDLIDDELLKKDRSKALIHIYFPEEDNTDEASLFLRASLDSADISYNIKNKLLKSEDYRNNWKKFYKPLNVGKNILIKPLWIKNIENPENRKILNIEPGLSFGTGSHETTSMCISLLEKHLKNNDTVLDIGTGSGILAISALLCGALKCDAVDIDPIAVKTAKYNGILNNFKTPVLNVIEGNLTDKINGKYNTVIANIVSDAIMELTPTIINFLKTDGIFISSGIISQRAKEVERCFEENNFEIKEKITSGCWNAYACKIKEN